MRWASMTAEEIRPRLAAAYMKLPRDLRIKLAKSARPDSHSDLISECPRLVEAEMILYEDDIIDKFSDDIGRDGVLLPIAVLWLISQICVVQHGAIRLWQKFSICVFQMEHNTIDFDRIMVKSTNKSESDWTALVHPQDNKDLSCTVLPVVLHNSHYSHAEITPRQDTGEKVCNLLVADDSAQSDHTLCIQAETEGLLNPPKQP